MPRQFVNPAPVLHDLLGIDPAFNGTLTFYEIGTTELKDTWSDHDMGTPNENPVPLDSAARTETQVWGDGEYTIVLRNEAGETVWTREWRPEQTAGLSIPTLAEGFLTNDGSNLLWGDPLIPLDPTGQSGRLLSTDGANFIWIPQPEPPEPPEPDWAETDTSLQVGDMLLQMGVITTSGAGGHRASGAISFPIPFTSTPRVFVQVASYSSTSGNATGTCSVTGQSTTGATVNYDVNIDDNNGAWNITTPPTVHWFAMGKKTT